jgi:hypothetical protein
MTILRLEESRRKVTPISRSSLASGSAFLERFLTQKASVDIK